MIKTLEWTLDGIRFIDQTRLPLEEVYVTCRNYQEVATAIRDMIVRGAPAIGVAAAMGIALGIKQSQVKDIQSLQVDFEQIAKAMAETRPTAVNLFWTIWRMRQKFESLAGQDIEKIKAALVEEALQMYLEDIAANQAMGRHGAALMPSSGGVLTHSNAGALATCGYGTALGVIRAAVESGKRIQVFADETRPFLQGTRLTAWELVRDGIQTTVIADNMAAAMMRQGKIKAVIVGASRIAANGDVANEIGTYTVALLARSHRIPFYVAAPWSTIDLNTPTGEEIPIEQRSSKSITHYGGRQMAPDSVLVESPAFDVTPAEYITAIVTERGIVQAPYEKSLKEMALGATPFRQMENDRVRPLRIFLCHAFADKPEVRKLYWLLRNKGFDPWLDEEQILPGLPWQQEIEKALRTSDVVIVCLSPNAIAKTGYVQKEIKHALNMADEQPEGKIFLIPLKLEECDVPDLLRRFQWLNYFEEKGFEKLLKSLRSRQDSELALALGLNNRFRQTNA